MLVKKSYLYIKIGLNIRLLRNIVANDVKNLVKNTLDDLVKDLEEGDFQVTLSAMNATIFLDMVAQVNELETDKTTLGESIAKLFREHMVLIEMVIFSESIIRQIYVLPNRRFNSEFLLNSPHKLLKDGTFNKLDEIAKQDITSACRCILFGEATAAAFHILRATESVLKSYYFLHKKQKRLKMPMWGSMVRELSAKPKISHQKLYWIPLT